MKIDILFKITLSLVVIWSIWWINLNSNVNAVLVSSDITTTNTQLSLSQQLALQKDALSTKYGESINTLKNEFTRITSDFTNNANYNSLVCLWIIQAWWPIKDMEIEHADLNESFLEAYVSLNAEIFNILNKYSVWLLTAEQYSVEKEKLKMEIENFWTTYDTLLKSLQEKYLIKIMNYTSDLDKYAEQNKALLKKINEKVIAIQGIVANYNLFEDGILQINSSLSIDQQNFFSSLNLRRDTVINTMNQELDGYIQSNVAKFINVPNYYSTISKQKKETVEWYISDIDSKINNIFWDRYDRDQYLYMKEQVELIQSRFYIDWDLNCQKLLTTEIDLEWYTKEIQNTIDVMVSHIENWLKILEQSGQDNDIKESLLLEFEQYIKKHYLETTESFKITDANIRRKLLNIKNNTESENTITSQSNRTFQFTNIIKLWDNNTDVKKLQEALNILWYYKDSIDGQFGPLTKSAVYQFQKENLDPSLLKDPGVQGLVGPSTIKMLNKKMVAFDYKTENDLQIVKLETKNEVTSTNIFLPYLYQMAERYEDKTVFIWFMQKALIVVDQKINDPKNDTSKKIIMQKIKEAIQLYINENT